MTPTELTELDRLLAEFMGVCMGTLGRWDSELLGMLCAGCGEVLKGGTEGGPHHLDDWHPTSDIAQAMMVATKAWSNWRLCTISGRVFCEIKNAGQMDHCGPVADSEALAICLAARAWLAAQPTGGDAQ